MNCDYEEGQELTTEEYDKLNEAFRVALESEKIPPDPLDALTEKLGLRDVTTKELSLILGLSDRRISQLWQSGNLPEPAKVKRQYYFPLLPSINWYLSFLRER